MNKFEQVSSDGHHMPLAGGPISDTSEGTRAGGVQYGPMYHGYWSHRDTLCEQTDKSENITFPQLRWSLVGGKYFRISETQIRVSVFTQISSFRSSPP